MEPENSENAAHKDSLKNIMDLIHDIRNPMSVIYTTFEILCIKNWASDRDELLKHIKICKAQLDRVKVMLSNYADMNRAADMPYTKTDENIPRLIEQVVTSFAPRFGIEKKKLNTSCPETSFQLDRNIFKQMLHNMIEHMLFFTQSNSESFLKCSVVSGRLCAELSYSGGGDLSETEKAMIFGTSGRVIDKKNGVKYNKGFGLTYNLVMSRVFGGNFELIIDPATLNHFLRLELV